MQIHILEPEPPLSWTIWLATATGSPFVRSCLSPSLRPEPAIAPARLVIHAVRDASLQESARTNWPSGLRSPALETFIIDVVDGCSPRRLLMNSMIFRSSIGVAYLIQTQIQIFWPGPVSV